MRLSLFDSGFQKILLNKDVLPPFKTKLHLPDSILKAEDLGFFEMLTQQNWTMQQLRRMLQLLTRG